MVEEQTRICKYCGRNLPLSEYPRRPDSRSLRYRICRECRAVGHSCLRVETPKLVKEELTDEERIERKREYMRRWRADHPDKVRKYRQKERRKRPTRPAPVMKAKPEKTYTCTSCGKSLPADAFMDAAGRRRHGGKCSACREAEKALKASRPKMPAAEKMDIPMPRPERIERPGCESCINYPCFEGFENTETDFAREGCHFYHCGHSPH